ncbi:MAG: signal peptidase I [Parcubacteria group bacterium LiPW_39]|nr:MAG: signal peptidase I [Parcubacteria group bacterium LiPW_39]
MEPNFEDGQYLIIDELSYRYRLPQRGEVVVFRYPLDPSQFYIKRIIGLPGETLEISDGRIKIFSQEHSLGFILDESKYLPANIITSGENKIKLGEGEYFILGDNRQSSFDSRRWGVLLTKDIIGRVWFRAWPPQTAKVFAVPEYSY